VSTDAVHNLGQVIRTLPIAGFIAAGALLRLAPASRRRSAVRLFIAYSIAVSLLTIAARIDCWPFSTFSLMAWDLRDNYEMKTMNVFRAVDTAGNEWPLDPSAYAPVRPHNVRVWFTQVYPRLDDQRRRSALLFLLQRAESSRRAQARGSTIGEERLLGPLAAPGEYLYRRERQSPLPYIALRVYEFRWRPPELFKANPSPARRLIATTENP
jgi:hypothetical protein